MPDWGWVAAGFVLAYGSMAAYGVALHARHDRLRQQREKVR